VIPAEARRSMEGMIPSVIGTASADGNPNVSYISQVWYVDSTHVALSHQFFNKTMKNLRENPRVVIMTIDPPTFQMYALTARHLRTETSGPVFDDMSMQLEAIASMTGMSDVFELKAAEIFEVVGISKYKL
jgi:predicted pyridoxine 5'-phosphate oxidase superfamily flavin-nucleotide-binding protein